MIQASPQLYARLRSGILLNLAETTPLQRWACRTAFALAERGKDAPFWQSGLRVVFDRLVLAPIRRRIGFGRARLCLSSGAVSHPDVVAWFAALGCDLIDVYGHAETGGATAHCRAASAHDVRRGGDQARRPRRGLAARRVAVHRLCRRAARGAERRLVALRRSRSPRR